MPVPRGCQQCQPLSSLAGCGRLLGCCSVASCPGEKHLLAAPDQVCVRTPHPLAMAVLSSRPPGHKDQLPSATRAAGAWVTACWWLSTAAWHGCLMQLVDQALTGPGSPPTGDGMRTLPCRASATGLEPALAGMRGHPGTLCITCAMQLHVHAMLAMPWAATLCAGPHAAQHR